MMSLWDALRMNMMISYQELVRTFLRIERSAFTKSKFDMIFLINHHCEAGKKEKYPIKIITIKIIPNSNNPLTISESL